jgi:hypothetical protein
LDTPRHTGLAWAGTKGKGMGWHQGSQNWQQLKKKLETPHPVKAVSPFVVVESEGLPSSAFIHSPCVFRGKRIKAVRLRAKNVRL